jgi:peroxin-5
MMLLQGLYEDSIRYYVRAVAMNPKADNAWQYLRISLKYVMNTRCSFLRTSLYAMLILLTNHMMFHFKTSNASRVDMIAACDARNLDALQKEFPL